jgi:hypothetical protein
VVDWLVAPLERGRPLGLRLRCRCIRDQLAAAGIDEDTAAGPRWSLVAGS